MQILSYTSFISSVNDETGVTGPSLPQFYTSVTPQCRDNQNEAKKCLKILLSGINNINFSGHVGNFIMCLFLTYTFRGQTKKTPVPKSQTLVAGIAKYSSHYVSIQDLDTCRHLSMTMIMKSTTAKQ